MTHRTFFKWDEKSRVDAQLEAQRADEANQKLVYRYVTARENHRCRICDTFCDPDALTLLKKGHHHHVVYRSAGGDTSAANVILACARCHDSEHQHRLRIEGNANEEPWLTLWKQDERGEWFVWRREVGIRQYEKD